MSADTRLSDILERLIAFRTVTGDMLAAHMCLSYAEQILVNCGMTVNKFHSGGYESLVATSRRTKHPKVLLQAHIDVVPAAADMFVLDSDFEGRLSGRGTFDMKYAAACFLRLAEELKPHISDYDFGIMLTSDEEATGAHGVPFLLKQGYGCDTCILPDGGDDWQLETSAKGGWAIKVTASGQAAHGSRPWEGDNAIEKIVGFLKQAKRVVPSSHPDKTTMVISQISGGLTHNQVPDAASVTLDIRYADKKTGAGITQRLQSLASQLGVHLETINTLEPIQLDPNLPSVRLWEGVVENVRNQKSKGYMQSNGASDARFFAEYGIPCIVTRPLGGNHHGDHEWIDKQGFHDFYACIRQYVEVAAKIPVATEARVRYTEAKLPETVAAEVSA